MGGYTKSPQRPTSAFAGAWKSVHHVLQYFGFHLTWGAVRTVPRQFVDAGVAALGKTHLAVFVDKLHVLVQGPKERLIT
jgi:hypothetical protein